MLPCGLISERNDIVSKAILMAVDKINSSMHIKAGRLAMFCVVKPIVIAIAY
jgi:hypothetical protein